MGLQDRRYGPSEGESGFRRALRRIFVEGDNFFGWSLPLFRVAGIDVRIHIIYVVIIITRLLWSAKPDALGFRLELFLQVTLFVLVLLHEFGHCLACRKIGGEADQILMWPLGGLAYCRPPHNWKAALVTTIGGPAVNLALIPVFGGVIMALGGGWDSLTFNVFDPRTAYMADWYKFDASYLHYMLGTAYVANLYLFLFNMCLVMFPMDAGRILQELLWRRIGYRRSMMVATNVGIVLACLVGVFSLVSNNNLLFGIAVFAGITSFFERRRVMMLEDEAEYDLGRPSDYGYGPRAPRAEPDDSTGERRRYEQARKRQQADSAHQAEVDRVLAKIAESGMGSLSRAERRVLERETERRRNQESTGGGGGGAGGGRRGAGTIE